MTRSAPTCELCDATAQYEVDPSPGCWTAFHDGHLVLLAPYRTALLCELHRDVPLGICSCPGAYGETGTACDLCGEIREHLIQRGSAAQRWAILDSKTNASALPLLDTDGQAEQIACKHRCSCRLPL